ncbi:hypothetical protein [Dictyobacter arantiisoli]|uniref:Uncharacterized protein n=1 Tax=Dictyobacter arantiisoli TaxID=2014874 RepID=A0A5A5TIH8_9CHLR|nr:hypothetical protein [Dictyobacter arantiisoli]GCF11207.1 hypothetical protein KDI_47710 [Dictyobacter arantiisoli]
MPLDARKLDHLKVVSARTWMGRQKTMMFVTQSSNTFSAVPCTVLFRSQTLLDLEIPNRNGLPAHQRYDALLVAPMTTNFAGVAYIADTASSTPAAILGARKYQVLETVPGGMLPGGTHITAYLRHFV